MARKAGLFIFLWMIVGAISTQRNERRRFPRLQKPGVELAVELTGSQAAEAPISTLVFVQVRQDQAKSRRKRKRLKPREVDYTDYEEDDFNPFSDVDETAAESSEYEEIDHTGEMKSTIEEGKAQSSAQQTELNDLATKEAELEDELNKANKEKAMEKESANLERKKSTSLESRLIKELLLNRAEKKRRMEEIIRRKASEAKNMENIKKLIDLQNQLQLIKEKMGDADADCTVSPCRNGGVCVSKQPTGHECMCPQNYGGANCLRRLSGQMGYQYRFGATITLREVGSEVEVSMPLPLMFLLTVLQIGSFLTCLIQCCLLKHRP